MINTASGAQTTDQIGLAAMLLFTVTGLDGRPALSKNLTEKKLSGIMRL
jgi:hypothetical protein